MVWSQWEERLFVERLEEKSLLTETLLQETKNNWEVVLFRLLMKNFGLNKNGEAFLGIAKSLNDQTIKKISQSSFHLESIFYGQAGFYTDDHCVDEYYLSLKKEFDFLKSKFQITQYQGEKPVFFGLRPSSFPTIRLSQLASLYGQSSNLFGLLMETENVHTFFELFDIIASDYWDTHYTFGKTSKSSKKRLTKNFIELLLINTVIPLKFCYNRYLGKNRVVQLMDMMYQLSPEKNQIISGFKKVGRTTTNAFESQAKIQLYKQYCSLNRCLQCQVGAKLLGRID